VSIKFRPHHFLCALGFEGKGYSPEFIANFANIAAQLQVDDSTVIEVVGETDDICRPCPHRQAQRCESQAKIDQLDQAHARVLGLRPGDELTWQEAKARIKSQMSIDAFNRACAPCEWKRLGICEKHLRALSESCSDDNGGEDNL
jgi:uncharacterized protein